MSESDHFLKSREVGFKPFSCQAKREPLIMGNGFGYGFVAEKSAGIFPMNSEYIKKRWIPIKEFSRNEL